MHHIQKPGTLCTLRHHALFLDHAFPCIIPYLPLHLPSTTADTAIGDWGTAMAKFFRCTYLSERDFKVYPKVAGDKFHAWELRYFNDCFLGSDQRHFPTMLDRNKHFFAAAEILSQSDHFLQTRHAAAAKATYAQRDQRLKKTETGKAPQELTATTTAPGNTTLPIAARQTLSLPDPSPEPPAHNPIVPTRPAVMPPVQQPLASSAADADSTGLRPRWMPERCCSTLALLILLRGTALGQRKNAKIVAAHNCLATLFKHFFSNAGLCGNVVHAACELLPEASRARLSREYDAPAPTTPEQLFQLALQLEGLTLRCLLIAAAHSIDDSLPTIQSADAGF